MLKWTLRYYASFVDSITIYDNQSTDGTAAVIGACPKACRIPYDTGGLIRDFLHVEIKSNFKPDADWRILIDTDELFWHPDGLRPYLEKCTKEGITFPQVSGWDMIGDGWPQDDGKSQLWQLVRHGVRRDIYAKRCVVGRQVETLNYLPGCHVCNPTGVVVPSPSAEIRLLHYKWLNPKWTMERMTKTKEKEMPPGIGDIGFRNLEEEWAYYERSNKEKIQIT